MTRSIAAKTNRPTIQGAAKQKSSPNKLAHQEPYRRERQTGEDSTSMPIERSRRSIITPIQAYGTTGSRGSQAKGLGAGFALLIATPPRRPL